MNIWDQLCMTEQLADMLERFVQAFIYIKNISKYLNYNWIYGEYCDILSW